MDCQTKSKILSDDGCIAEVHNSAKVWIAHSEYTISKQPIDGEFNTIVEYRYQSGIPKKRKLPEFGYVYSTSKSEFLLQISKMISAI